MPLPTVILLHQALTNCHHDWLLADPRDPDGPLWTARTLHPPTLWRACDRWLLVPLPPHRRLYLTHEGPLAPGPHGESRGSVRRVDQGWHVPQVWTDARIVTDLNLSACAGRVELRRISPEIWQAAWV